jgi:hypothetical protein
MMTTHFFLLHPAEQVVLPQVTSRQWVELLPHIAFTPLTVVESVVSAQDVLASKLSAITLGGRSFFIEASLRTRNAIEFANIFIVRQNAERASANCWSITSRAESAALSIARVFPSYVGQSRAFWSFPSSKYSDCALLLWVLADIIAKGAPACCIAFSFASALLFYVILCGVKDRDSRGLAGQEAKDGKSQSEDDFSHFSSP